LVMPAALSCLLSAALNGLPSRAARRRPIDDLPAHIMPTSTTERRPSARWMRASGRSSACLGTAPLTIPSFQIVVTGSIYQQSGPPRGRPFRRLVASLPAGYSCFTPPCWTPSPMPSLFRFLMFIGLIGGLAYGAVFSLATFVKYQQREIIVTLPADKFVKQRKSGRWPA